MSPHLQVAKARDGWGGVLDAFSIPSTSIPETWDLPPDKTQPIECHFRGYLLRAHHELDTSFDFR